MRTVMSILVVLMMAFALVSSSEAGWFPYSPGDFSPYACIASPAYAHYTDARAVPCTERDGDRSRQVSEPMGSPGF